MSHRALPLAAAIDAPTFVFFGLSVRYLTLNGTHRTIRRDVAGNQGPFIGNLMPLVGAATGHDATFNIPELQSLLAGDLPGKSCFFHAWGMYFLAG